MANEFDPSLPSTRQVQTLIKAGTVVQLKLLNNELLTGKIVWQDQNCLCLIPENQQSIMIWWQAIAYLQVANG